MAVSMGIGRFAYTPILPLMHAQAGLTAQDGSALATANYVGYLVGALFGIFAPGLIRSALVFRAGLIAVIVTVALMATTHMPSVWITLRLVAGIASALVFVIAASALLSHLSRHEQHLAGWGFGGVGAGIAVRCRRANHRCDGDVACRVASVSCTGPRSDRGGMVTTAGTSRGSGVAATPRLCSQPPSPPQRSEAAFLLLGPRGAITAP